MRIEVDTMRIFMLLPLLLGPLLLGASCAETIHGPVLHRADFSEVEVRLGGELPQPGEGVRLVRELCRPSTSLESPVVPGPASVCQACALDAGSGCGADAPLCTLLGAKTVCLSDCAAPTPGFQECPQGQSCSVLAGGFSRCVPSGSCP